MDAKQLVSELNDQIFNHSEETGNYFSYSTWGYGEIIKFAGIELWNSEDDSDRWDDTTNKEISLEIYVPRKFAEMQKSISKITLTEIKE